MDYEKILSPIKKEDRKKKLEIDLEAIEKNINKIKRELSFQFPEEYIKMLKTCDGGRFDDVYVPCRNKNGEIDYNYIDIIYGVLQHSWTIQESFKQNLDEIINEDFSYFVSHLLEDITNVGQVDKFKEEGALPDYIDNEDPSEGELLRFYMDLPLYKDKLDAFIGELDNLTKDEYEFVKFQRMSLEFATMDGHCTFHLFYEDESPEEPSVWYVYDLEPRCKLASNFKEFMKMLLIQRNEIVFGLSEINEEICLFINKILVSLFDKEPIATMEEITDKVTKSNDGYRIELDKKVWMDLDYNEYPDGSGFREFYYKKYKFIFQIGYYHIFEEDLISFKEQYEERIFNIIKESGFASIIPLFTIGYHNLIDVISQSS